MYDVCVVSHSQEVFEHFDMDGSGRISINEMGEVFKHLGVKLDQASLNAVFKYVRQQVLTVLSYTIDVIYRISMVVMMFIEFMARVTSELSNTTLPPHHNIVNISFLI